MRPHVIVLGAGMIGVGTALQLARRGHAVCLVDRRVAGQETSFGNAGLVQCEAVEPYPFPLDLPMLTSVATGRSIAARVRYADLPGLAPRLARYAWASTPGQYPAAVAGHSALIAGAVAAHEALIAECGAQPLLRRTGYHWVFRTKAAFDEGQTKAARMAEGFGVQHRVLDRAAWARTEPALIGAGVGTVVGAIHFPDPLAVTDPGALVQAYHERFLQLGGRSVQGDATTLAPDAGGWQVRTAEGTVSAEHAVVALGPWSDTLLRPLGYRMPLFVKRGYHHHFGGGPLNAPMLDAERGYVLAPMDRGIRLTTGAEFAEVDAPRTRIQVERAAAAARELFPLGPPKEADAWMGRRPCTPDMRPVIGAAPRHRGLWFNFGHAHQGFTLGPVCGSLVADLIEGTTPPLDLTPYSPARFGAG